jgi:hypothetical protein
VSGPAESNGRAETAGDDAGVLANLPRTRPQRATARRAAARSRDAHETPPSNGRSEGAGASTAPTERRKPRAASKPAGRAAAKPAKAAKPVKAAKPAKAAKPLKNAKPAKAKPARTVKPAKAAQAAKPAKRPTAQRSRKAVPKRPLKAVEEEVPRQGFESQDDRATGSVEPPGGTEFVGTAAEIVSELAKAGISGGERLLRDVLSRLGR